MLALDVEIWLVGNFLEGGTAVIRRGGRTVEASVSTAKFAVLALLIMASHADAAKAEQAQADENHDDDWVPQGYRNAPSLKAEIIRWTREIVDPKSLARHVYRVRELLAKVGGNGLAVSSPQKWARQVLETGTRGYRLSTPASNLHLKIVPPDPGCGNKPDAAP